MLYEHNVAADIRLRCQTAENFSISWSRRAKCRKDGFTDQHQYMLRDAHIFFPTKVATRTTYSTMEKG